MRRKIEDIIQDTNEENQNEVDWTKAWSNRYPILNIYQDEVDVLKYAQIINEMLLDIEKTYGYSKQDAMLVIKDILYHEYKK